MDTELQNPLSAFCKVHVSLNSQKWPTSENELAEAFVKHFKIPFLADDSGSQDFLSRTNIELRDDNLPPDLLGVNMSFAGKRRIYTSKHVDHLPFRVHTVLHEIREVIEADFIGLGLTTTGSQGLDSRADEFACAVVFCSAIMSAGDWFESAPEMNSNWQNWAGFCLFTAGAVLLLLYSFYGAFGYRFQDHSTQIAVLKHN
jgi:hypothetical protein